MARYRSTRGCVHNISFEEAVFMGLAPDKGLLVPETIPQVSAETLRSWQKLPYCDLAAEVMSLYIDEKEIPKNDLSELIKKSYSTFRNEAIVPVRKIGDLHLMELFHGPTFAFKDIALQFLGNLFEYLLAKPHQCIKSLTILGATSGDTGSSAIAGVRGRSKIDVFILFPEGRVSPIQERQMTTILDHNVHNLAVQGTFDDCQHIVKECFADSAFKAEHSLAAVNSINWARILAQIVYYFYSYFRVLESVAPGASQKVNFSVPTGNFGDILAGYYAKSMGLPIKSLIVATNENDILDRFFKTGAYKKEAVTHTIAPSMDICVSSNFERYLFHLLEDNSAKLSELMQCFEEKGQFSVTKDVLSQAKETFSSVSVQEESIRRVIKKYYEKNNYVLDPHTAIGVAAAEARSLNEPTIVVATAHPGKFLQAVENSLAPGSSIKQHPLLECLTDLPTKLVTIPNSVDHVKHVIVERHRSNSRSIVRSMYKEHQIATTLAAVGIAFISMGAIYLTRRH